MYNKGYILDSGGNMNNKICSFFGHKEITITEDLKNRIRGILDQMIKNENFTVFYFGGFGMFDDLCWQIITELKDKYMHIKRVFCLVDPRHQRISKRPKCLKVEDYEEFIYLDLEFDWWYTRIYYRNCEIVNQSDFIVFYANDVASSGAYKIYQYAKKNRKNLINLAE